MKKLLKKIIPNKVVQIVRLGISNIYYYLKIKNIHSNQKEKVFVFGTSIHKNLGDHLITLSEIVFLKKQIKESEVFEIPTEVFEVYKSLLIKKISYNDLIIINGGGWMGNLWEKEESIIEDMVYSFRKNKIIIFPQTVFFDESLNSYKKILTSSIECFSSHPNLTISVREQNSFEFAKKMYKQNKILLVPDIALYYYNNTSKYRQIHKKKIIKICLRNDRENTQKNKSIDKIIKSFKEKDYIIKKIDTISRFRVSEFRRVQALSKKFEEFAESSLIITDRLHGMIFSYLTATPCIVIDNKTHKVSGVYEKWLNKSKIIFPTFSNTLVKLDRFILEVINNDLKNNDIDISFNELIEEVKKWQK